jgi:hypothetical protein
MAGIIRGRHTAMRDQAFVVFVIGMRINSWRKVTRWLSVAAAMPRMLRELAEQPELGYLGGKVWFGQTIVAVQYWRDVESLNAYARAREHEHLPAWKEFNRAIGGSGDVGIFHETYRVEPGAYECVYVNMPRIGLGAVAERMPATGSLEDAEGRMAARRPES